MLKSVCEACVESACADSVLVKRVCDACVKCVGMRHRARVRGVVARHPAQREGREAGERGVVAAPHEVSAQAGLEVSAGVGAATRGVRPPDELEHVAGERVERDHGEMRREGEGGEKQETTPSGVVSSS